MPDTRDPDAEAVDIIARQLHCLPHPDGRQPVRYMAMSTMGKPPAVRDQATQFATRAAQAIVHTLKSAGKIIIDRDAIPPAAPMPVDDSQPRVIEIWCGLCAGHRNTPLFRLTLRNPATNNRINIGGPMLLQSLHQLATDCPHMIAPPVDRVAQTAEAHGVTPRP